MNCVDLGRAKAIYKAGGNVTEFLRAQLGTEHNTAEIIEIAYDLQAGTYIEHVTENADRADAYAAELYRYLEPFLNAQASLLDVGTGELTTLSLVLAKSRIMPAEIYAFDISWSRLHKGLDFWQRLNGGRSARLLPFVADMAAIPLASKSIDIVTSSHALEPNGENLKPLLMELFRVCKDRLVLFEPSYEMNSAEGRARMDRLGYIKGLEAEVESLGGRVIDRHLLTNTANPLNPTACYIIEPSKSEPLGSTLKFSVPGTDYGLTPRNAFWVSADTGLAFPVLEGIPVLKVQSAILASSLFD